MERNGLRFAVVLPEHFGVVAARDASLRLNLQRALDYLHHDAQVTFNVDMFAVGALRELRLAGQLSDGLDGRGKIRVGNIDALRSHRPYRGGSNHNPDRESQG